MSESGDIRKGTQGNTLKEDGRRQHHSTPELMQQENRESNRMTMAHERVWTKSIQGLTERKVLTSRPYSPRHRSLKHTTTRGNRESGRNNNQIKVIERLFYLLIREENGQWIIGYQSNMDNWLPIQWDMLHLFNLEVYPPTKQTSYGESLVDGVNDNHVINNMSGMDVVKGKQFLYNTSHRWVYR